MNKGLNFKYNTILLLTPAIYTSFFPGKIVVISALCMYPIMTILWVKLYKYNSREFDSVRLIMLYIFLNIIIFVRGIFNSNSSQDWIVLFSSTIFTTTLFPLYIFTIKFDRLILIFRSILRIAIPLSFITYFFPPTNGFMSFQHNISIVYLFVFFLPFVDWKWKVFIIFLGFIGVTFDMTRRSFSINFLVSICVLAIYISTNTNFFTKISKFFFITFVLSPILFLILGLTGSFNVFTVGEYFDNLVIGNHGNTRIALVDSRTAIYSDVFGELRNRDAFIWGLGGGGKTKTSLSDNSNTLYYILYKEGRRGTESGMLNYFQWGGIITAFVYWLLLTTASYKAIYKSKNGFLKMLGLFMSFKVAYSFIEDTINVQISSFYLMLMIGICFNKCIRNVENNKIKEMVKVVFNTKIL